ncbi:hypothetical protein B0T16DRAFT_463496 [Cercophora newfieldiana]|uniref:Uncharacterized protein n=1 Tax=Cercophora newfieldiana TaxID=92897 RepID=A0AA40CIQ0_9PEZI|nr:hypothetical protein B0T16DRAFT_463496 [Cercophora newfieldiana]
MDLTTLAYLLLAFLSIAFLYDQAAKRIPSRLDSSQAPKARFGLVLAGTNGLPTRADGVDIVFVHGLGSNPDTTWRATKPVSAADTTEDATPDSERFVNWVTDFLPGDILREGDADVRIFFYNYDSYWKRDAVHTRLTNLGSELLEHINGKIRLSETERSRRLIFVAYSFGGLVVKRALVQAHSSRDFNHVATHTKAILFLGTPHRGTSFGPWGWLAAKALQPLGSNPILLADLPYDSVALHDMHRDFMAVAQDDLRVFNFFENRPTRILQLGFLRWQQFCVREQSATYESRNVRNVDLSVDHYGLNKFGSRNDNYDKILLKLTEVLRSSTRPAKRHYTVPLETVHTYTERAALSAELEQKLQIRHEEASVPYAVALYGLGGAGKSQLALAYAEKHKDRYNPILWIDATDEEAVRSSFRRCAAELGLPEEGGEKQESVFTDRVVQAVLRWLRDRTEADDEWLVVVDNVDDVSWGIQNIMPKGSRGSVIVTSRYDRSVRLAPWLYELVPVGVMSPAEAAGLLLQHLHLSRESASEEIRRDCDKVAERLGYLALALDLAGAYIGSDSGSEHSAPERALSMYLADYDRHRDELLRMVGFQDLLATQKTVWTVWNTTLEKIGREHPDLQPELLLTFLAQFRGSIIEDELFRLGNLGMAEVDARLVGDADKAIPAGLLQFLSLDRGEWDSFLYRKSRDILVRYSLIQRVKGQWPGVTMHSLVQWRARQNRPDQSWRWWYMRFILATCCQMIEEEQPEFRRHLVGHLPDVSADDGEDGGFVGTTLGRVYYDEGRWAEAEKLFVQVMETRKTKLGADHPDTLRSMANLTSTYRNQGRWSEAEELEVQVIETFKTKLGADHPNTLTSMANLALTFWNQGRWSEAEELEVQVMETFKTKLGADHPNTLMSMGNLASTYRNQGRWSEAEELEVQVMETFKTKLGADHPNTLTSMGNLASTYRNQGRWSEAEELFVQVTETFKTKLGADHPNTLTSMANLALTFWNQGRWSEAEELEVQVMETFKTKLGADHPDTLISMANLASTYRNQGRWSEAEELEVQVMETFKTKLGADHPDTLTSMANLASTFWNQGRWLEAEELFVQVMETSKTKLGADHPDTLTSMANLASTYRNQGRWLEAEQLGVQVMETRKTKLGADHPDTLSSMHNLAFTWKDQARHSDALALMSNCAEARRRVLGEEHPKTQSSLAILAAWNS